MRFPSWRKLPCVRSGGYELPGSYSSFQSASLINGGRYSLNREEHRGRGLYMRIPPHLQMIQPLHSEEAHSALVEQACLPKMGLALQTYHPDFCVHHEKLHRCLLPRAIKRGFPAAQSAHRAACRCCRIVEIGLGAYLHTARQLLHWISIACGRGFPPGAFTLWVAQILVVTVWSTHGLLIPCIRSSLTLLHIYTQGDIPVGWL